MSAPLIDPGYEAFRRQIEEWAGRIAERRDDPAFQLRIERIRGALNAPTTTG